MTNIISNKKSLEDSLSIQWPISRWTFSHIRNIEYAVSLLQKLSQKIDNPVIGYYLVKGWGTRDMYHRVLPQEEADQLVVKNNSFQYRTLPDLLGEMSEIKNGKYVVNKDGLIVGLNPRYF